MKQLTTTEKRIGDYTFYIRPFKAFLAANISAELVSLFAPIMAVLGPVLGNLSIGEDGETFDIMDMDAEKVINSASPALSQISGEKLEKVMKTLLIANRNIAVEGPGIEGSAVTLTEDLANEVFCEDLQNMFILCFEVVRVNFKGFFKKLGARFGNLAEIMAPKMKKPGNTESST